MITITNVTDEFDLRERFHLYRLEINRSVICHFKHDPLEGLSECLFDASEAVKMVQALEKASRFPHEENTPDPKDPSACKESAAAEANQAEADLEEKDRLAGQVSGSEEGFRPETILRAMRLGDRYRAECELASSKRKTDTGSPPDDHPGVRDPLPPVDSCESERGDEAGALGT